MASIQENLDHFFRNGKTLIVPLDHGNAIPVDGLNDPARTIKALHPHVDGFVVNYGMASHFAAQLEGKGVCLRTDVYKPANEDQINSGSYAIYGPSDAQDVGAHAMMNMAYLHHENEQAILEDCAALISEGRDLCVPLIVEALPYGLGQAPHYNVENLSFCARQAAEIGADVVKTAFPTDGTVEDFAKVVDSCFVPVIILGGAAMGDDRGLLQMVANAMQAGAAGVAIGRNVWQHPNPAGIAKAMEAVIHQEASIDDALELVG